VLMIVEWQFGIPLDAMPGGSWACVRKLVEVLIVLGGCTDSL
jgi:hypothetical protein